MKNSTKHLQDPLTAEQETCSEKKCITCFENRGCIYDRYYTDTQSFRAETFKMEKEIISSNANERLNM